MVYPPDKTREEINEANTTDFRRSERSAEYAALLYMDYPMAVTVENVNDPGPSAGKLQDGDAIDGVNGKPVANLEEFQALVKQTRPGDTIVLDYRRKDGPPGVATITLGEHPEGEQGYLGIGVLDAPWAPFSVDFNLANIGGPSAGMIFSLAVVDKLTPATSAPASSSRGRAPSAATDMSERSAASRTRCWPPGNPVRRSSWYPPTTAKRRSPRPRTAWN